MEDTLIAPRSEFAKIKVGKEFNMRAYHNEMQVRRHAGDDISFKDYLAETWGESYTPENFYRDAGIDLSHMTVEKLLNTSDLSRWLFPEVFRDAIRIGLLYAPFYPKLIISEEPLNSTGITMPKLTIPSALETSLRVTKEAATITEADMVIWQDKQVTIKKKARGLKMSYESIMFTPINLATVYFQEVGARLGSDLDKDFINVMFNGEQADNSEAAPVIGAATANVLAYTDILRAWVRFKRIFRTSAAMLMSEADALTVLNMEPFLKKFPSPGQAYSGVTLNTNMPLPSSQDIYVHDSIPTGKIVFVDPTYAAIQLTAMPLLVESEKIVARQLTGEYTSIMTGFAIVFKDGRLVLDYTTNLGTNPGPISYSSL